MRRPMIMLGCILFSVTSLTAGAAVIHVEKWGRKPLGDCGSKSNPCGSIIRAMSQPAYKKNATIRVGPGIYQFSFGINFEGVKLESVAGPRATVLRASNTNSNGITVTAEKVRIGKKGKGFSITGASMASRAGIRVESPRSRIEGNVIYGNFVGIQFIGMQQQVRFNEIRNNNYAGIDCGGCSRAQIRDNTFLNNTSNGLIMTQADRPVVQRNLFRGNGAGMWFAGSVSNIDVRHNVVEHGTSMGIYVDNSDGARLVSNISGQNAGTGMVFIDGPNDDTSLVKNNIAMGAQTQHGVSATSVENMRFEGNSAIQNGLSGLYALLGAAFTSVKGNNFYSNGQFGGNDDCAIRNESGNNIPLGKSFLGTPFGTPPAPDSLLNDDDDFDALCIVSGGFSAPTGTFQSKSFPYRVNRAAKL